MPNPRPPGETVTEGVREITYSGGGLPDDWSDEFTCRARLSEDGVAGPTLCFPVLQTRSKAKIRWIEAPPKGEDRKELEEPAPALILADPTAPTH
ncbi:DUF1775 domain-containing protein [Rubellimicrobium rubrum]|uniref:DUF1775 domain-containing protein n=1 Tax=Rubellimicrobium rubrum TaxID=2585369 RepID=A0A5C4N1H0_9RHOB|nr:DUF1775 domain-containing protein [Rubellimicrobium rubrum]TNC51965.1 DUF1775 domain-containing protein [Rubellimicrobium rubrum]